MTLNALNIDFNSYFATVEQQLRPQLRSKPIAVLAVLAETTCCIAASYEAKAFSIKTATSVKDARELCSNIIFVESRTQLYVEHQHRLIEILDSCTPVEKVLSIDEMVYQLTGSQRLPEFALKLATQVKQKKPTNLSRFAVLSGFRLIHSWQKSLLICKSKKVVYCSIFKIFLQSYLI